MGGYLKRGVLRVCAVTVVSAAVACAGSSCASETRDVVSQYCAFMPDTIGLYVGNPVTQMGYPIGKVTAITPGATQVRVEFSMTEQRTLPSDVKAIIRSPSILADRSLELVGNYAGGAQLSRGDCVPLNRSVSPKSLSEVIGSADTFVNAINAAGSTNVADTIRGVDQLAHGNGAGFGQLLTVSSALLDSPDQEISNIGSIIQNVASLTTALKEIRGPMKEILQDMPVTTPDLVTAIEGAARIAGPEGTERLVRSPRWSACCRPGWVTKLRSRWIRSATPCAKWRHTPTSWRPCSTVCPGGSTPRRIISTPSNSAPSTSPIGRRCFGFPPMTGWRCAA